MAKCFTLIHGTSSSGKTSISDYLSKKCKVKVFHADDYFELKRKDLIKINQEQLKKIKNNFGGRKQNNNKVDFACIKHMVDLAIAEKHTRCIFDDIDQEKYICYLKKKKIKLNVIVVFTNLRNLVRNIESRRKKGDPRGLFVFKQFAKLYIQCSDKDKDRIEKVNRKQFEELLLKYLKYEFKSKADLIGFKNNFFKDMGIMDDKSHYVKLRKNYKCDFLLKTTGKSKGHNWRNELPKSMRPG